MPPTIDKKKCVGSGECVDACPVGGVLEVKSDKCVLEKPEECIDCRACEAVCPKDAISFPE